LSGQVQAGFTPILQTLSLIKAGKLRALAVTGVAHADVLPDVPNAAQFVPGYDVAVWDAVGAPAQTPPEIVEALNKAINAALSDPKMQTRFTDLGATPMIMTPAELKKFMADEVAKWGKVVKTAGIKPE
jgi:tripartite-type tricarboxylate transporter receptor subunit TctC